MEQQRSGQSWWLLFVRSGLIGLMGLLLFQLTDADHQSLSYSIAGLMLLGGVCAIGFGVSNRRTEDLAPWSIANGTIEAAFGVALLFYARGPLADFLDVLGLWALLFAMAQATQAIYSYIGRGFGLDFAGKLIHILLVGVAGWLAFALMMRPDSTDNLLTLAGWLSVAMSGLLTGLILMMRKGSTVQDQPKSVAIAQ